MLLKECIDNLSSSEAKSSTSAIDEREMATEGERHPEDELGRGGRREGRGDSQGGREVGS